MKLESTVNYLYENCVKRVKNRLEKLNLPQNSICPSDKSLVSHFINKQCTKNNPYLITEKLMYNIDESSTPCGFIPTLKFKNEFEVLWGDSSEFVYNLFFIYQSIMNEILQNKSEYNIDIDLILCDRVLYAKYHTLSLIKAEENISLHEYYGVPDSSVSEENMCSYQEDALEFLYSKERFRTRFEKTFRDFANQTSSFTKISKKMFDNYIFPVFIPLLKRHLPSKRSLGLRVKHLIESDLSQVKPLIDRSPDPFSSDEIELDKMLINASSAYIARLEEIQELSIVNQVQWWRWV